MCSLYRGFVISRFFFIYFAITGVKKRQVFESREGKGSFGKGSFRRERNADEEVRCIEVPLYFALTVTFYSQLCPFF